MTNHKLGIIAIPEAGASAPASFGIYRAPQPESGMGKLGAFAIGVVAGIVGVTVIAALMEEGDTGNLDQTPKSDTTDKVIDIIR